MRRLFTPHSFLLLCAIAAGTGRVCAQSGPAPVLSQSLPAQTLTVSGPATTVNLAQFFSNPAVTGPAANPAGDGMPNLLKYALGLDPTMEDAAAGTPVVSTTGGMLTLTYVCPPGITDVTYVVEVSGDLETWSSGAGATAVVSTTLLDAQHEQVVVRDLTPVSGQGRRFIRLRVTE